MDYTELRDFDEVIDYVMECIGRKWTKSMIKFSLRDFFPGITTKTCVFIIYKAKKKIRELYNLDPSDYKGSQISFYESVIRGPSKIKDKLVAAERLDKLFGLEHAISVDVTTTAEKIQKALKDIDESVNGNGGIDGKRSEDAGDREVNATTEEESVAEVMEDVPENEVIKELGFQNVDSTMDDTSLSQGTT